MAVYSVDCAVYDCGPRSRYAAKVPTRRDLLAQLGCGAGALGLSAVGGCARTKPETAVTPAAVDAPLRARLVEIVDALEKQFPIATALAIRSDHVAVERDAAHFGIQHRSDATIVLRVFDGRSWHSRASSELTPEAASNALTMLLRTRKPSQSGPRTTRDAKETDLAPRGDSAIATITTDKWQRVMDLLLDRSSRVGSSRTVYRGTSASTTSEDVLFVGQGKNIRQSLYRASAQALFVARAVQALAAEQAEVAGTGGTELLEIPLEVMARASESSLSFVGVKAVHLADVDVVLDPAISAWLALEFGREFFDGAAWVSGSSLLAANRGDQIADRKFSLVDDPTLAGGFASYDVDHEGATPRATSLIGEGLLVGPFTDQLTAEALSTTSTGNGRLAHASIRPFPSNLRVPPGPATRDDLLGAVKTGYLIEGPIAVAVDRRRGTVMVRARRALEISSGSLTGRIAGPATLRADLLDLLLAIRGVGSALAQTVSTSTPRFSAQAPMLLTRAELRA